MSYAADYAASIPATSLLNRATLDAGLTQLSTARAAVQAELDRARRAALLETDPQRAALLQPTLQTYGALVRELTTAYDAVAMCLVGDTQAARVAGALTTALAALPA